MKKTRMLGFALVTLLVAGACTNPSTPAGHEGYVYHVPLIFGKMKFEKAMKGPASTGVSWRLFVTNIDMRARNYKEPFKLLTGDNLSVEFEVNTRIKLKDGMVQDIVEKWGAEHWYEWNVKERLRTIVRREVISESARNIQLNTNKLGLRIQRKLEALYAGSEKHRQWLEIKSVDIGQIKLPKKVTDAIDSKISKQEELKRQEFVLAKAKKEAAIEVLRALKVAKKQQIISSTLDPLYVQRKAVQVYRRLAGSPNKTIMVLPNSADGTAMPLVMSKGRRKPLTAADKRLLDKMEKTYMELARSGAKDSAPDITKDDDQPEDKDDEKPTPESDKKVPAPAPTKKAPAPTTPTPAPKKAPATP
jgi:regulator of protease activity HflC (stomatin/prohibitin superfamily)